MGSISRYVAPRNYVSVLSFDIDCVQDLSYLNRDLSKVILIDTQEAHARLQPENAIILEKWKGDPKDKGLVALIPFLEYVASMGFEDVRPASKDFKTGMT